MEERQSRLSNMDWKRFRPYLCVRLIPQNSMFSNSFDYLIKHEKDNTELQRIKELKSFVLKNFNVLEISHFERLYNQIDEKLKGVFNYQFRMHPAINEVIKQFYKDEGGLECGLVYPKDLGINDPDYINNLASRFHGITAYPIDPDVHVLWIDSSSPEMLDGTSRVNYGEVEIIRKLLRELNDSDSFHEYNNRWSNVEDKQIGLISFYGKQLRLLMEMAREFNPDEMPIRVSTVDRFRWNGTQYYHRINGKKPLPPNRERAKAELYEIWRRWLYKAGRSWLCSISKPIECCFVTCKTFADNRW